MRILVVDEQAASRMMLVAVLGNLGHECITAGDGTEAWDTFLAQRPNVVITDLALSGMSGVELCRNIRKEGGAYSYFIMVTSHGRQEDILEGMSAGADDYLMKSLNADDLQVRLIAAARVTALHRQLGDNRRELDSLTNGLSAISLLDPLTNLGNRRSFQDDLKMVQAQVVRYARRSCMALLDVDSFKGFNDTYGHMAGDEVLVAVSLQLKKQARSGDALYRYGGDQFVCLFPEQSLESGAIAVERIRSGIQDLAIPHLSSGHGVMTISAGLALVDPAHLAPGMDVLREADTALHRAKDLGRNRTEYAALSVAAPVN